MSLEMASTHTAIDDGEKRERVTWFPVVAFNGLAETCANYIDRGRL
jgi:single-stranded DNA-binding protein